LAKDPYQGDEWQRLFMEQRSHMARAGIHAALLLNGGAAVALLAFMGQLAGAGEVGHYTVNFAYIGTAFAAFGGGVLVASITYLLMYQISLLRIHDTVIGGRAKPETIDRIRWIAISLFILSLVSFLFGLIAAVMSVGTR
jgi:hypothetical protein